MSEKRKRLAVYPGIFDPITNGHLDVIRRGAAVFDELVVAVGQNPSKSPLLSLSERADIIKDSAAGLPNVRVATYTGLTVDFVAQAGADVILRGIRNGSDLDYEFQMAMTNRAVAGVETVFILAAPEYAFASSTLIRQIARMGGDISALVPPKIASSIKAKLSKPQDR